MNKRENIYRDGKGALYRDGKGGREKEGGRHEMEIYTNLDMTSHVGNDLLCKYSAYTAYNNTEINDVEGYIL